MVEGRRIEIQGTVQGVGFRPWVYRLATAEGLVGRVWNDGGGVRINAFGPSLSLDRFEQQLTCATPPSAQIEALRARPIPVECADAFEIVASEQSADRRVSIPADLATCAACERELKTAADRRHAYAFTNCTNCGPRFTIIREVPYDRCNTTMAAFRMCPACRREYFSPDNRRFHAQPNACPVCGPRVTLVVPHEGVLSCLDPISAAGYALRAGQIVAVKGIGGFHLACDAKSDAAVRRLRARKHRDEKPFAVMMQDLAQAERHAEISDVERELLLGPERPIVLVRRRAASNLAPSVAPRSPLIGLFLPYSPLHHLLLAESRRPLVMTSGNVSDQPLACENHVALQRLGVIADLFLMHNRDIETPCDDSVVRVIGGAPTVLRRARGYVPRPISLARPVARPTLGCGALLNNTFCLAHGDQAVFGPHIGDLDDLATFDRYQSAIRHMEKLVGVKAEVLAADLHPSYHSSRYARLRDVPVKVGVQHHHAHVASLMAEHGLSDPMLGVAFDGTGAGTDGTAWGGEFLITEYTRFDRVATFRPILLAGGDAAIKAPWRIALALLLDAFGCDAPLDRLQLFAQVSSKDRQVVEKLLVRQAHVAPAHGVGRYFDAIGALLLAKACATYEGQIALELNALADSDERGSYDFDLHDTGSLLEIDMRPGVRALTADLLAGQSAARLAARFHRTIGRATATVVAKLTERFGDLPVGLTGGCFQNTLLVDDISERLARHRVYLHRRVPPGDGGLALGQVVVANAVVAATQGSA